MRHNCGAGGDSPDCGEGTLYSKTESRLGRREVWSYIRESETPPEPPDLLGRLHAGSECGGAMGGADGGEHARARVSRGGKSGRLPVWQCLEPLDPSHTNNNHLTTPCPLPRWLRHCSRVSRLGSALGLGRSCVILRRSKSRRALMSLQYSWFRSIETRPHGLASVF